MSRLLSKLTIGAAALLFTIGAAVAQTPPPAAQPKAPVAAAPKAAEPAAKAKGQKKATTPWGIACAADADKQNLHGKPRKSFMSKCGRDWQKAHAAETAAYKAANPKTAKPATKLN